MSIPSDYSFTRYLAAKKTIDDRALNRHVWDTLVRTLSSVGPGQPLRLLEVGAGIGTMLERIVEWDLISGLMSPVAAHPVAPSGLTVAATAIDSLGENIDEARNRLLRWGPSHGLDVIEAGKVIGLRRNALNLEIELEAIDLSRFARRERSRRSWDLVIAHAFLDLVDVPRTLPQLLSLTRARGLLYFTITFDAATILQPEIDHDLDKQIEMLYHKTMDERLVGGNPSGDSHSGRHLFHALRTAGANVLDMGSSDWVVFPGPEGYPGDAAYFLHFIIHSIDQALRHNPNLETTRFSKWIDQRHAQIERGELVYIAHQLDLLAQAP